jgi:hypothetical protein
MRVDGRWHLFRDGIVRPVVDAAVQNASGGWTTVMLLLDSGADRTVFDASLLPVLAPLALPAEQSPELRGVGGDVQCVFVQTAIALIRDDGRRVTIRGPFGVFTNPSSSDVPVLGRDVTNNFDVLYGSRSKQVTLLAPPHAFQIRTGS